mgnify:CR=1 FL=1
MPLLTVRKLIQYSMTLEIEINPQQVGSFVPTHQLKRRRAEKRLVRAGSYIPMLNSLLNRLVAFHKNNSNAFIDFSQLPEFDIESYPRYKKTEATVADFLSGNSSSDSQVFKTPGLIESVMKNGVLSSRERNLYKTTDDARRLSSKFADHSLFGIGRKKELIKVDKGETRFYIAKTLGLERFPLVICYIDSVHRREIASVGLQAFIESLSEIVVKP